MEREMPAPVAAERNDRDRTIGYSGVHIELAEKGVDPVGVALEGRTTASAAGNVRAQLVAGRIERSAQ
jgi:hypothetical protein